ncbi:MAG: hypothetical protein ACOYN2_00110 [Patescibacteria group bacterium]
MNKSIFTKRISASLIAAFAVINEIVTQKPQKVVVFEETDLSPAEFGRLMNSINHDNTKTVQVPNGKHWTVYTTCEKVTKHLVLTKNLEYKEVDSLPTEISELFLKHRADTSVPYGAFKSSLAFIY